MLPVELGSDEFEEDLGALEDDVERAEAAAAAAAAAAVVAAEARRKASTVSRPLRRDADGETTEPRPPSRQPSSLTKDAATANALKTWYKLDENAVPPVYRLQNVRLD